MPRPQFILLVSALCNLGVARADQQKPTDNLELPDSVTFRPREADQAWLSMDDAVDAAIKNYQVNCEEQQLGTPVWWTGEGEGVKRIGEVCVPKTDPAEVLNATLQTYRTSMFIHPGGQDQAPRTLELEAFLPAGTTRAGDTRWCWMSVPTSWLDPDESDKIAPDYSDELPEAVTPDRAKDVQKSLTCSTLKPEEPRLQVTLPEDSAGIAWWMSTVVKEKTGTLSTVYNRGVRSTFNTAMVKTAGDRSTDATEGSRSSTALTTALLSGVDQGAILIGLTDYLLERADAELRAWVVESQVSELCRSKAAPGKLPGAGDMLVQTCAALDESGISLLFSGASVLQDTARADMRAFLRTLGESYIRYGNGQPGEVDVSGVRQHDVVNVIAVLGRTLELVLNGDAPLDALAGFAADERWSSQMTAHAKRLGEDYPLSSALYLSAAIVASLQLDQDGHVVLPEGSASVGSAPTAQGTAASLALATAYNLERAGMKQVVDGLWGENTAAAIRDGAAAFLSSDQLSAISAAVQQLDALQKARVTLVDDQAVAQNRAATLREFGRLASATLDLSADILDGVVRNLPEGPARAAWSRRVPLVRQLGTMAGQVAEARYGLAVAGALRMVASYIPEAKDGDLSKMAATGADLLANLGFVATLAESDSAQSAHDTIAAWAAPVGSYLRKHDDRGAHVGLNAYVGAGGGMEWVVNVEGEPGLSNQAWQAAPAMLVGLDVGGTAKKGRYYGAFLSVLDLGALATVRAGGDDSANSDDHDVSVDYASKLRFQQVFAPGAYFVVAPWRAPVSLGLGGSLAPSLRNITITEDGSTVSEHDAALFRASLLLALDLSLSP